MTTGHPLRGRISRESRLLILTVIVSVIVLLLLARLRFPEPPTVVQAAVQPLERLAARASYDDLARDVARAQVAIESSVHALRIETRGGMPPIETHDILPGDTSSGATYAPALRVGSDVGLVALDAGLGVPVQVVDPRTGTPATLLGIDRLHGVAAVRLPQGSPPAAPDRPLASLVDPAYVVVVEASRGGVSTRPVFLGRGDRYDSARWTEPLLPLGSIPVAPGALIFAFDGAFIGLVVSDDGAPAIAAAADVRSAARAAANAPPPSTLGIAVQDLTPSLAAALRVTTGIVVSDVATPGPGSPALMPGDAIVQVAGTPVRSADDFQARIAALAPETRIDLSIVRDGAPHAVRVTTASALPSSPDGDAFTGVLVRGDGTRLTRVGRVSPLALAGLHPGDVVTRAGHVPTPPPAQLQRLVDSATAQHPLIVLVRRDGRQHVAAVSPHAATTDPARTPAVTQQRESAAGDDGR